MCECDDDRTIVESLCEQGLMTKDLALSFINQRSHYVWQCIYHGGVNASEASEEANRLIDDKDDLKVVYSAIDFYYGYLQNQE